MKILVGYDGSDLAKKALKLAQERATVLGANLEVVMSMEQNHQLQYEDISKTEYNLKREVRDLLNGYQNHYETVLFMSKHKAGEGLVEFAKLYEIDEIVIGVSRRSRVGKFLLGSTAQHVFLNAPCPVITIK
jgi:nucleotide-binding universal stress UspA family protein